MIHPNTRLRWVNDMVGFGVVATRPIPRGTMTWVQDPLDQVLSPAKVAALWPFLGQQLEKYSYVDCNGDRILNWDNARFMNHSCEANTLSPGTRFEIAISDIAAGEQVTCDYATLNLERPFTCSCGSSRCRGTVAPEDFPTYAHVWDQLLSDAFSDVMEVSQPLWHWLQTDDRDCIRRGSEDRTSIPSILNHRYTPTQGEMRWHGTW